MEVDELTLEIEKSVQAYTKEVETQISEILDRTANQIIDYIKSNAPKSGRANAMADSFIKESFGEGANKTIVIYSKTKSSIVHLIEFGFKHRSGVFVSARPFMRPAYEAYAPKMLEDIRKIIGGAS